VGKRKAEWMRRPDVNQPYHNGMTKTSAFEAPRSPNHTNCLVLFMDENAPSDREVRIIHTFGSGIQVRTRHQRIST